jgi:SSS family solute:Na+ symporter
MSEFGTLDTAIIITMVAAYIVFTSWLTIRLRSRTSAQFMVAARALPAVIVGVLLMSEFIGAQSTVGTSQAAFLNGIAAAWSVLATAIGYLLFGLVFVRIIYRSGSYTISGAIEQRFGRSTMISVSIIMMYAMLLVNVGNYISGAAAISTVMRINLPLAMVIIAVVSTIYYLFGGLKGVAWVTLLHTVVKVVGLAIIVGVALSLTGGLGPMLKSMPAYTFTWDGKVGGSTIGAWIIGMTGAIFSTQFIIQAISGAKSAEDARRACLYSALFCVPLALALAFIGVAAKYLFPSIDSLYALPVFLQHMHPFVAGIVAIALIASVFVSVSTVALAIVSLMIRDFYVPYWHPTEEQQLRMSRILSLVVAVVPLIFVFAVPQILRLAFFSRALRLSISMVALVGVFLPFFSSNRGATIGLWVSAVVTTVWYLLNNPFGIDNMYVAAVAPLVVMAIDWACGGRRVPALAPQPAMDEDGGVAGGGTVR